MTVKVRIPGLVDLGIVERTSQILEIDSKPGAGRELRGTSSLLGWMLTARLRRKLRVGNTPLPTFCDRDAPGRQAAVDALEGHLQVVDFDGPGFRADVARLAYFVARRADVEVGIVAQQIVGRCLDPGFRATRSSYDDARMLADWVTRLSPRAAWRSFTGELERARDRMWRLCRHDRAMLHGTVLALPNVVQSLERMRELYDKRPQIDVDAMLRECLQGPPRLLRIARTPIDVSGGPAFAAGALLIYDLASARRHDPGFDVFMGGRWNQCPAHALVPRLLGTVWKRAQRDARRPRGVRFVQAHRAATRDERPPLTDAARMELTPGNLETLKQWELDQLYASLNAGATPKGAFEGRFFFPEGSGLRNFSEATPELSRRLLSMKLGLLARLGGMLWKGKVFFPDQGVVRNIVEYGDELAPMFGEDPAALRRMEIDEREVPLMFPAKLFRGESLADPGGEAIIIDYDDAPQIDGYVPNIDFLASRKGLRIRDEIRQIRPGLYLGRAYTDQRLLLMFSLYSEAAEALGDESNGVAHSKNVNGGSRPRVDAARA